MKIIVDQQSRQVLEQVCDMALRNSGLGALKQVNTLLLAAEKIDPPAKEEK